MIGGNGFMTRRPCSRCSNTTALLNAYKDEVLAAIDPFKDDAGISVPELKEHMSTRVHLLVEVISDMTQDDPREIWAELAARCLTKHPYQQRAEIQQELVDIQKALPWETVMA